MRGFQLHKYKYFPFISEYNKSHFELEDKLQVLGVYVLLYGHT